MLVRVTDALGFSNVATKVVTIFPTPGAVLQGNLLRVNGSTSAADVITLSVSGTSVVVQRQGLANRSFPLAGVARVVVVGFAGNDTLQAAATFPRQVPLFGGVGNDTLRSGADWFRRADRRIHWYPR